MCHYFMDLANLRPVQQYGRPDFGKAKACRKPTFLFWQKNVAATLFPQHGVWMEHVLAHGLHKFSDRTICQLS